MIEDHPYDYASFEGVIPAGQYGAGEVIVWDCGVYSPDEGGATWFHDRARAEQEVRDGMEKGKLSVLLRGEKLKGSFALVRTKEKNQWLMIKHKDRFAVTADVTAQNRSVLSGKTVEEIKFVPARAHARGAARSRPARSRRCRPSSRRCSRNRATRHSTSADWMWEPKLDGYRVLAFIDGDTASSCARAAGSSSADKFPRARRGAGHSRPRRSMILDGELVAFDANGRPSFGALQDRAQLKTEREIAAADQTRRWSSSASTCCISPASICASRPMRTGGAISRSACCRLRWCSSCTPWTTASRLSAAALASGFEGVIGKRKASRYESGRRSASWLKVKPTLERGFRRRRLHARARARARRSARCWSATGTNEDKLRYASHVGLGLRRARARSRSRRAWSRCNARPVRSPRSRSSMRRRRGSSPKSSPK